MFGPFIVGGNEDVSAAGVLYDNKTSKLAAQNVQAALDLLAQLVASAKLTVDKEIDEASENPVQNKVVQAALALKAATNHKHSAGDINSGVLPVAQGGTGQTTLEALATAMGGCKIQTGSYVGTGTSGASNPCSLTFDFSPKILMIVGDSQNNGETYSKQFRGGGTGGPLYTHLLKDTYMDGYDIGWGGSGTLVKKDLSGKTISWYTGGYSGTAEAQMNDAGHTYYFVAIY